MDGSVVQMDSLTLALHRSARRRAVEIGTGGGSLPDSNEITAPRRVVGVTPEDTTGRSGKQLGSAADHFDLNRINCNCRRTD